MEFKPSAFISEDGQYTISQTDKGWIIERNINGVRMYLGIDNMWKPRSGCAERFAFNCDAVKVLKQKLNPIVYTYDNTLTAAPSRRYSLIYGKLRNCAEQLGYPYFMYAHGIYDVKSGDKICDSSAPNVKVIDGQQ